VAQLADLNRREAGILVALLAAVFWLGLFPAEPMRKTEVAARQYQQMVHAARSTTAVATAAASTAAALATAAAATPKP
jgi:NADH:ubiquinone oxidoreductase subunit 4 (subunit M)